MSDSPLESKRGVYSWTTTFGMLSFGVMMVREQSKRCSEYFCPPPYLMSALARIS